MVTEDLSLIVTLLVGIGSFILGCATVYSTCVRPIERRLAELEGQMKVLNPIIEICQSLGSIHVVEMLKGDRK